MADCVHIRCADSISCRYVPAAVTFHEVARCDWCRVAVVFVPEDLLWVRAAGSVRPVNKIECGKSPTNRHEVRQ